MNAFTTVLALAAVLACIMPASHAIGVDAKDLCDRVNAYRVSEYKQAVPISRNLITVAETHSMDLAWYMPQNGGPNCTTLSWSDEDGDATWFPCCYEDTDDSYCVRMKPTELTTYDGIGYSVMATNISARSVDSAWAGFTSNPQAMVDFLLPFDRIGCGLYAGYATIYFARGPEAPPAFVCDSPLCVTSDRECVQANDCRCASGFNTTSTGGADGPECQPLCVDMQGNNTCDANAVCVGADICECNVDYTGDGKTCTPICETPCAPRDGYCAEPNVCACRDGFEGDGFTCVPPDEVTSGSELPVPLPVLIAVAVAVFLLIAVPFTLWTCCAGKKKKKAKKAPPTLALTNGPAAASSSALPPTNANSRAVASSTRSAQRQEHSQAAAAGVFVPGMSTGASKPMAKPKPARKPGRPMY